MGENRLPPVSFSKLAVIWHFGHTCGHLTAFMFSTGGNGRITKVCLHYSYQSSFEFLAVSFHFSTSFFFLPPSRLHNCFIRPSWTPCIQVPALGIELSLQISFFANNLKKLQIWPSPSWQIFIVTNKIYQCLCNA